MSGDRGGLEGSAVDIDGRLHRAPKRFYAGTHRTCSPEETLARVRPHFAAMGITRLADVSGLDVIPISTVIAVRPNSRTLAAGSGKGFTKVAATASAVMEAIEHFHAERPRLDITTASHAELSRSAHIVPVDDLQLTRHNIFSVDRPEDWVRGWDIAAHRDVMVPQGSVVLGRWKDPRRWEASSFQMGSNGLASGNALLEAIVAGLYECIERDATSSWKVASSATGIAPPRLDPGSVRQPLVRDLIERLASVSVDLALYDCTIDTDVPTYLAEISDEARDLGSYAGYGTHLDPEIAMIRAVTEAVQGRVVYVAGSRDDVYDHSRHLINRGEARVATMFPTGEVTADPGRSSEATETFEGDMAVLMDKLRRAGLDQVIVIDLTRPEFEIPVVKVVVPGTEGYMFPHYLPGRRARAFTEAVAERDVAVAT